MIKFLKYWNSRRGNVNDLNQMLNFITLKLPIGFLYKSSHDVNGKKFTSFVSMTNDNNGKAQIVTAFAMIICSNMSLHAFGSIRNSTICIDNI